MLQVNPDRLELQVQVVPDQLSEGNLEIMELVDKVVADLMDLEEKVIREIKELLVLVLVAAAEAAAVLEGRVQTCPIAGDMMEGMVVVEMLRIIMNRQDLGAIHLVVLEVLVEIPQVLREAMRKMVCMEMMVRMGMMVIALLEILDIIIVANKVVMEVEVPMDLQDHLELLGSMVCQATKVNLVLL